VEASFHCIRRWETEVRGINQIRAPEASCPRKLPTSFCTDGPLRAFSIKPPLKDCISFLTTLPYGRRGILAQLILDRSHLLISVDSS
jgi:hypothetical protein